MDLNLTQPILFNGTLNATLIQPSDPWYKDWFPAIISIFVIILGGLITYYVNFKLDRDKRQFELKKEVYFDSLNTISDILVFAGNAGYNIPYEKKFLKKLKEGYLSARDEDLKEDMIILGGSGKDRIKDEITKDYASDSLLSDYELDEIEYPLPLSNLINSAVLEKYPHMDNLNSELKRSNEQVISDAIKKYRDSKIKEVETREKLLADTEKKRINISNNLRLIENKMRICGAPKGILYLFPALRKRIEKNQTHQMVQIIQLHLLPALNKDLLGTLEQSFHTPEGDSESFYSELDVLMKKLDRDPREIIKREILINGGKMKTMDLHQSTSLQISSMDLLIILEEMEKEGKIRTEGENTILIS